MSWDGTSNHTGAGLACFEDDHAEGLLLRSGYHYPRAGKDLADSVVIQGACQRHPITESQPLYLRHQSSLAAARSDYYHLHIRRKPEHCSDHQIEALVRLESAHIGYELLPVRPGLW
jgi:hypothetical protein